MFTVALQDDSRAVAMSLFPDLSPQLKRKKDHGKYTPQWIFDVKNKH